MSNHRILQAGRLAAVAFLSWSVACCGGASVAATRSEILMQPQVGGPFVYGCASAGDFCNVYGSEGHVLRSVTSGLLGPVGIAVDSAGSWYVANSNMSDVLVFPGGRVTLEDTLADSGQAPPRR